eukprot:g988.t1
MDVFLGPMSVLSNEFYHMFLAMIFKESERLQGDDKFVGENINTLSGGKVEKYFDEIGQSLSKGFAAKINLMPSFVGPEVEEIIRNDPDGKIGRLYISFCKRSLQYNWLPMAVLLRKYGGHLLFFDTPEEFKKRWPLVKSSGWLRNLFFLQFLNFCTEFEEIIMERWSKGDYTLLFPTSAYFPHQMGFYVTHMLTRLREQELELGTAEHKVITTAEELEKAGNPEAKVDASAKAKEKKKQYVVAASTAAASATPAVAAIHSQS